MPVNQKIIVVITKRGHTKKMLKAAKENGIKAAMVLRGKGTVNPHMFESLLGLTYDPDRDVILALCEETDVSSIKTSMVEAGRLHKKDTGILFVVDVDKGFGIETLFETEAIAA